MKPDVCRNEVIVDNLLSFGIVHLFPFTLMLFLHCLSLQHYRTRHGVQGFEIVLQCIVDLFSVPWLRLATTLAAELDVSREGVEVT